jgi:hypothetical protein
MCTPYILRELYLMIYSGCVIFFIEFIDNKKLEECNGADNNIYILRD